MTEWLELTACDGESVWVNASRIAYFREGEYYMAGTRNTRLFLDETRPNEAFAVDVRQTPRHILEVL